MDFDSNSNIGIYMFVNDKFALVGHELTDKKKTEIEKSLGVPIYKITILGTDLLGLFVCGNNDMIIVPEMFEYEENKFKEICDKHKVKMVVVDEIKNTFGSNVCVGNDTILINDEYLSGFEEKLKRKTKYKVIRVKTKMFNAVGATIKFLNGKYFLSQEYSEDEVKLIVDDIAGIGTINSGSNYISSGVVGNSNGVIIGSASSSVEIQNIVESLDYL